MMDEANEEANDPLAGSSLEEVKIQNRKLRNAINSLTYGFEEERKRMDAAFKDETEKDKKIAELQQQLQDMDDMVELFDEKEEERKEMEIRLEEIVEYENMVEEMVQEIAKKDEEIEEIFTR